MCCCLIRANSHPLLTHTIIQNLNKSIVQKPWEYLFSLHMERYGKRLITEQKDSTVISHQCYTKLYNTPSYPKY
jgi:hypothetical protein